MSDAEQIYEHFQSAILKNDAHLASDDIKVKAALKPQQQLDIYIQGYRMRLTQAIRSDYPALLSILGDGEFDKLALQFIDETPSESHNLDRYPHGFSIFIRDTLENTFTIEVAELESSIAQVFMADESEALPFSIMQQLTEASFAELILKPRIASRLMNFTYPVEAWFRAEREGQKPAMPIPASCYLYMYRHTHNVQRAELSEAAYLFLEQLFSGITLSAAMENVLTAYPQHMEEIIKNAQVWFADWLKKGFFRIDS